jgi:SET domain-containing protein
MFIPAGLELKESPIHGLGIFATQDFLGEIFIGDWLGVKYPNKAAYEAVYSKDYRYTYHSPFPWNPVYSCREDRNFISFINHSDTPNTYLKRMKLYSKEVIRAGTELTLRYPNNNFGVIKISDRV